MSDAAHLLIPLAMAAAPGCREAIGALQLPGLRRLLARLTPGEPEGGSVSTLSMPHERALAQALGLPAEDGRTPWAAWERRQAGEGQGGGDGGQAWAWITPCHWVVGRDHIDMRPPEALGLTEAESRTLFDAMRPYFEEDGVHLQWQSPLRWLARGEMLRELPCASLERVAGRVVDDWLPRVPAARPLRRLQQEMQMLLYTHPVNEAREGERRPTVNSFWASGAGALPADAPAAPPPGLVVERRLQDAAAAHDWPGWTRAWHAIDAEVLPALLQEAAQGRPVTLTLCGERAARSWTSAPRGWGRRLSDLLRPPAEATALESL